MAKTQTGDRLRRFVGLLIGIVIGTGLAAIGWMLPGAMAGTGVEEIPPELQAIARRALIDTRDTLFDEGIESLLPPT